MTHPEPLQQAARELAKKHGFILSPARLGMLCEALLTKPRDEWRNAMLDPEPDDTAICPACNGSGYGVADTQCGFCGGCGGVPLAAEQAFRSTPTEQPEPSEDYRRRACDELNREQGYGLYAYPRDVEIKAVLTVARLLQRLDAVEGERGEPVAWQRRLKFPDTPGAISLWEQCPGAEAKGHFERKPGYEYRALYAAKPEPTPEDPNRLLAREAAAQVMANFDHGDKEVALMCQDAALRALDLQDERIERMSATIAEQAAELHKAQAALFSAMRDLKANGLGYSRVQSAHDSIRAALQKDQTNG